MGDRGRPPSFWGGGGVIASVLTPASNERSIQTNQKPQELYAQAQAHIQEKEQAHAAALKVL